jgi:hypothetical protein
MATEPLPVPPGAGAGPAGAVPGLQPHVLPEAATVHWRPRVDEARLRAAGRRWTLYTTAHVVPFLGAAALLTWINALALPVAIVCVAHAWIIPELYAQRGANVARPRRLRSGAGAERMALGLLGDLVGHEAREVHARTGLVPERGRLGLWLVGEQGALLLSGRGRRRIYCYCVRVADPDLPAGDRTAHLLLALRSDEQGFATVANMAFSGATWRIRRRLPADVRPALDIRSNDAV